MIYNALRQSASGIPDHPAIIMEGRVTTFQELKRKADNVRLYFEEAGIRRGDRVLILLDNGPEYAALFFGLLGAGAAVVPLNPTNTPSNVRYIAGNCAARFAVANERAYPNIADWWKGSPVLVDGPVFKDTVPLQEILEKTTPPFTDGTASGNGRELALVLYTSGTTGEPKGVMLSNRNLVANTQSILEYLVLDHSDRTLAILPFYYSYGNSLLLTHVFSGATLVVENRFAYLSKTLAHMKEQRVTGFSGVPSHFAMLLGRSRFLESDWPRLRYMTSAGGPLPVSHIRKIRAALPQVELHVMYGQTEGAARLSSLDPSLVDRKIGSIGKGIPGVELRVVRNDGRNVEPDETGEIVARGENIMMGYLGDPQGTAEVLRDGWLHTGDLATVDRDGFIYIRGREKEFIKSGGYRIGPQQIEEVILQQPSVQECGVVGAPDEFLGEQIIAFVVIRRGIDQTLAKDQLLNFLREHLPSYMIPSRIVTIDALPKTESGKIQRMKLREWSKAADDFFSRPKSGSREHPTTMLLHEYLINSARNYPDKSALVTGHGSWTYGQLDRATDSFAGALLERGFRKGDRLGIHAGNCMEAVVGIFGALKAGGAFVLINPAMKRNKVVYILLDAGCTALLTSAQRLEGDPLEILSAVPSLNQVYLKDAAEDSGRLLSFSGAMTRSGRFHPPSIVDVDLAALIYTSGSTGFPKGVAVTHLNMVAAARSISSYLENGPDDVVLNVLPLSFDYGLYQVLMMFMAGGKIVLDDPSSYPMDIVRTIRENRVTGLPCVSTIFSLFTRLTPAQCKQIDTLRYITNTGSALNVNYTKKIREMFPAVRLFSMYGLTECKRVSYLPPEEIDRRPGSVGKAMPNVEVYIVKDDGAVAVPGETGELVVRGSNVMQGYWGDPEATSRVLKQGKFPWEKVLYTGDLFRTDEEGFLYFIARKDEIIKTRGEKVSPKEVENVILGLGDVREVVVVGVPDDVLGYAIHAHVVLSKAGALSEEVIRAHCSRNLEPSCIPKAIHFYEEIPRNSSGKVDKSRLNGSI